MYLNYDQRNQLTLTKLTCVMTTQAIFFVLAMVYLAKTIDTFNQFGWGIDQQYNSINGLPLWAQSYRLNFLFFLWIYGITTCFNAYYSHQLEIEEWKYLPWCCMFSFVLFPYFILLTLKSGEISYNWNMYFRGSCQNKSNIDLHFKSEQKIKVNTIVYLIALVLFFIGFILIFIHPEDMFVGEPSPSGLWLLNKLCYFTNLSNIFCFIYLLGMLFFNRAKIFNNHGLLIALTTYILIVGMVYWCLLFPVNIQVDVGTDVSTKWTRAIWLHAINPIIFFIFYITSIKTNKLDKTPLKKIWWYGIIYPFAYGILMYSIPFLIQATIYGYPTNLNPYMILPQEPGDIEPATAEGNPLWILITPIITSIFIGLNSLLYFLDYKLNSHSRQETKHSSLY